MDAKIQGTVLLDCVVFPDDTVGDVHIVRSLDLVHGLDKQVAQAVKQWTVWRFMGNGRRQPRLASSRRWRTAPLLDPIRPGPASSTGR